MSISSQKQQINVFFWPVQTTRETLALLKKRLHKQAISALNTWIWHETNILWHKVFHKCYNLPLQKKQLTNHLFLILPLISSPFRFSHFCGALSVTHISPSLLSQCCHVFGGKLRFSRWDREMERKHLNWYVCLYFLSEDVRSDMSWEEDREEEAEGGKKVDDVRKKRKHWKAKVEKSERKIQARYKQRDAEWQAGSSERQAKTKEVISKRVLSGLTCGLWIVLALLFFKYSFKQNVYISRH